MAKKTLPPYFLGTADCLTFYKRYGQYYVRMKSSLTAERVKKDPCFAATMWQASIMARASRIGSAAYAAIPAFCREYKHYRILTGKANLLLKQGLHEDEIIIRLIAKYIIPLKRQTLAIARRIQKKRKRVSPVKPAWLRKYRRLKMVEGEVVQINTAATAQDPINALSNALRELSGTAPPARA